MKLPVVVEPVVSLKVAIARGTLNAPASAIGVMATKMTAIAIMASMSLLLDFPLGAGAAMSSSDPRLRGIEY